jgi:hypothetical protein
VKVKLLVGLSGPTFTLEPGDIYECDDSEATRLICARYALPIVEQVVETAAVVPVAETRKGRGKK